MSYKEASAALESSIRLGFAVEADDIGNPFYDDSVESVVPLSDEQIAWLAAWLAGEGFSK